MITITPQDIIRAMNKIEPNWLANINLSGSVFFKDNKVSMNPELAAQMGLDIAEALNSSEDCILGEAIIYTYHCALRLYYFKQVFESGVDIYVEDCHGEHYYLFPKKYRGTDFSIDWFDFVHTSIYLGGYSFYAHYIAHGKDKRCIIQSNFLGNLPSLYDAAREYGILLFNDTSTNSKGEPLFEDTPKIIEFFTKNVGQINNLSLALSLGKLDKTGKKAKEFSVMMSISVPIRAINTKFGLSSLLKLKTDHIPFAYDSIFTQDALKNFDEPVPIFEG